VAIKQWNQAAKNASGIQLSSGTYDYIIRDARNLYTETVFEKTNKEPVQLKIRLYVN
jgi:hypothetical protein